MLLQRFQVYLTGGYTWDPENKLFLYTTDVFYIDLQLGYDAVWTQVG